MLDRDELPGYRVITQSRTSNQGASSEASHDRQHGYLSDEIKELRKEYPVHVVKKYNLKESAATMDRDSMREIKEKAKNDEFDILMVWAIHRLSRADPWETFKFLLELRKHNIIIYSDRDGYFDWADPDDAERLTNRIITSREWRNEINRGARENNEDYLKKGMWPYGPSPYGTVKKGFDDDDIEGHELVLKSGYKWVPEECFLAFKKGMKPNEISNHIESLVDDKDIDISPPTKHQVENILQNEVFLGKLVLKRTGELVREKEDLQCVDPELYTTVQEMLREDDQNGSSRFESDDFPGFVYKLILRFGQEYVVENVDAIRWCCPKCSGTDVDVSDTTVEFWGINIPRIHCKESHCDYNGPAIRMKELHEIDTTLPLICPTCQRTGYLSAEPITIDGDEDYYKYTCQKCGDVMIKNKHPNTIRRGMNDPDNAIELKAPSINKTVSDGSESNHRTSATEQEDGSVPEQVDLDSFN